MYDFSNDTVEVDLDTLSLVTPFTQILNKYSKEKALNNIQVRLGLNNKASRFLTENEEQKANNEVINICNLPPIIDKSKASLSDEVSDYRIKQLGLATSFPVRSQNIRELFFVDYLLSCTVCYVEVMKGNSVNKLLVTKNVKLACELSGETDPKKINNMIKKLQGKENEYFSGRIICLKINQNKGGFSVSTHTATIDVFNTDCIVTPFMFIHNSLSGVLSSIGEKIYRITYLKDNMTKRTMDTTLNMTILNLIYGQERALMLMQSISLDVSRGIIRVPEIDLPKYDASGVRVLNANRILSIEEIQETDIDLRFIDVDFSRVLPFFKMTVTSLKEKKLLIYLYEQLLQKTYDPTISYEELEIILCDFIDSQYALGTTTVLKHLHLYMLERPSIFEGYNEGKKINFNMGDTFNLGLANQ